MLEGFLTLLGTIFGWLGDLLPTSPLSGYAVVTEQMTLGLRWLNWVLPLSEMLLMLVAWMAALLAVTAVKVALGVTGSVGGKVVGS